jgi:hypothetical protein
MSTDKPTPTKATRKAPKPLNTEAPEERVEKVAKATRLDGLQVELRQGG